MLGRLVRTALDAIVLNLHMTDYRENRCTFSYTNIVGQLSQAMSAGYGHPNQLHILDTGIVNVRLAMGAKLGG